MTPVPLVIIGAGGFAREALDVVDAMVDQEPLFRFLGFLDDGDGPWPGIEERGHRVIGATADAQGMDARYAIGIGDGAVRATIDERLSAWGLEAATLIHPAATFGHGAAIGDGTIITAGARVTSNVALGRHVHLNLNSTVGHDARLGDHVTVSPGANVSGGVTVGPRTLIGTGSSINQNLTIGADATVGAGAVVVTDVPPAITVVGVPARPRRTG